MRPGRAMTAPRECEYNAGAAQAFRSRRKAVYALFCHMLRSMDCACAWWSSSVG